MYPSQHLGYVWFPENAKEMKKKIQRKIVFFSLDDMENMMEKINIKENIKKKYNNIFLKK